MLRVRVTETGSRRSFGGFTLIELLVALALLSIMSALTYRAVAGVLEAERQVKETARRWQNLAIFFEQVERDALQAVDRPIRDQFGMAQAAWILRPATNDGEDALVEWTRFGDSGVRDSDTRRIGYRLRAEKIEYLQWPTLDRAAETGKTVLPVAAEIRDLRWRCLTRDGRWIEFWPMPGTTENLPRAIEVLVTLRDGSTLSRLIAVGAT